MPRLVYASGVGLLLVALAFIETDRLLAPPPTPGVTQANVKRLRPGMTPTEVEAVLGPRPLPLGAHGQFGGAWNHRWSGDHLFWGRWAGRRNSFGGFGSESEKAERSSFTSE